MTMRTYYKLKCDCGHEGQLKLSENDQPYSTSWESWSVEGFNSSGSPKPSANIEDVITQMNVTCPACKKKLSGKNLAEK